MDGPAGMIGQTQRVKSFPFVIGRNEGDLIIPDPHLSRRHVQISFDPARGVCLVTDLESRNGSHLDSLRLLPAQAVEARSGTLLRLGPNVVLRLDVQK
jgi:pSer/pThr/pTyr-binding forkhead associated (FHA) protein